MKFVLTCSVAALVARQASALDADLARFVGAKQSQLREYAQTLTNKVPTIVWSFFDAVRVDDWETATNLSARIELASGQSANSTPEAFSPGLRTIVWPVIQEVIGTYEEFHKFDNKWLHRFGREIIDSIPKGSIYFGGTDPGRFIITALSESHREGNPFFTLTQNQLVDMRYLDYLRKMYGGKLYIPTEHDSQQAFSNYLADASQRLKEGKLKPGEDVRMVGDRVEVSGQVAVMQINAGLAKTIVDKNAGHKFYVEESFPLEWMYPHLTPHGLIFELQPKPLRELTVESVHKDQSYWNKLTGELIGDWVTEATSVKELSDFTGKIHLRKDLDGFRGDKGFVKNEEAQKCFSKLRSSIGGLYAWRATHAGEAEEKGRMQKAAEVAFKQAFALCPSSPEAVFRYVQLLLDLKRPDDALALAKTAMRVVPDDAGIQGLVRDLSARQF